MNQPDILKNRAELGVMKMALSSLSLSNICAIRKQTADHSYHGYGKWGGGGRFVC